MTDVNLNGLEIRKPAGAFDGEAGAGLRVIRDARQAGAGSLHLNPGSYFYTITGKQQKAFEWVGYAQLDNYADEGENVGWYMKGNKFGKGPTWGGCSEVCDTNGLGGPAIGHEVDCWVTGKDDGVRPGLNVVVGDSRKIRNLPDYGVAEATAGVQINESSGTPWARWIHGIIIRAFTQVGLLIDSTAPRAIWLKGKYVVGLDMSDAEVTTPLRFKAGQRITLEATDSVGISFRDNCVTFDNCGRHLMSLDITTGNLRIAGKLTQGF